MSKTMQENSNVTNDVRNHLFTVVEGARRYVFGFEVMQQWSLLIYYPHWMR